MDEMIKQNKSQKSYRVAARFLTDGKTPVTLVDGVAVSLSGKDLVKQVEATLHRPPQTITVKQATPAQLKKLFEEGCELIEEVDA